jgi:hypothetical protein
MRRRGGATANMRRALKLVNSMRVETLDVAAASVTAIIRR